MAAAPAVRRRRRAVLRAVVMVSEYTYGRDGAGRPPRPAGEAGPGTAP